MPREVDRKNHKAKWGQHFLIDDPIIERILNYADIRPTETILEIGGGTGNLTRKLARKCQKLSVIEADWRLAERLRTIPGVEVLHGDALRLEFCLLYTSDAADDLLCVDLGGRRIIKKK